jgi:glycosyltransferase involved in cell wall biosynthesis
VRIAQVAPLSESVPPKLYGGIERVVAFLTDELVGLDHHVTLFASGDSVTAAELVPVCPRALRLDGTVRDAYALQLLMLELVFRRADEFDLIHFHLDCWPFSLFSRQSTPFLSTIHGRLDLPELLPIYRANAHVPVVSVSDAQRDPMPWLNWIATVYHGLPEKLLTPKAVEPTYLACLGRIAPEKRVDRAIEIARRCGLPIKIAAKVDPVDRDYFEKQIKPLLALPHVQFIGEIDDSQKADFLSGALALLFCGDWPEPFGLAMIEAMACGTPVIAFKHGAIPEVVEHGQTGFVVSELDEGVHAVKRLVDLSRGMVRRRFEDRFTAARMADDYLQVYKQLGTGRGQRLQST